MSLTTAIIVGCAFIGVGVAVGFSVLGYFLFRLVSMTMAYRVATTAKEAAMLMRAANQTPAAGTTPEKKVTDMPDIGLHQMADSPDARKTLRKKQNSTPQEAY